MRQTSTVGPGGRSRQESCLRRVGDDDVRQDLDDIRPRSAQVAIRIIGPESPHTARSLLHLAATLREQGDAAVARTLLQRALAIYAQALTPEHPRTAECRHALEEIHGDVRPPAYDR